MEGESPRKVKRITFDGETNSVDDGRTKYDVPSGDSAMVMKRIEILCKVSQTRLDCVNASPALRKVLSNVDFTSMGSAAAGTMGRRVPSSNNLSRAT